MTEPTQIQIAILSDLHAFSGPSGDGAPSWLSTEEDQGNPLQNPFAGLKALIKSNGMTADIVMCCGDMGHQADPKSQQYAWQEVNALQSALKAQTTLAAAGNHDMDSRFQYTSFDARGQVQALDPRFPIADEQRWMEYWAKNYTFYELYGVRFVLLNSAAYHGVQKKADEPEYLHGRISDRTLDALRADLERDGPRAANVLVCHHHPCKNDHIKSADYSHMENGDRLLNLMTNSDFGPWLIIHGHKHMPHIRYATGGNAAPTIFSAGSFSARLYAEYGDRARNEFYILDLKIPKLNEVSSLQGKTRIWQWSWGGGWHLPRSGMGLGPSAAFGTRTDLAKLAKAVADWLRKSHLGTYVPWAEVIAIHPEIEHLIPEDLTHLLKLMKNAHSLRVTRDDETDEIAELQANRNG